MQDRFSQAEALFAEYLATLERDPGASFERFVESHEDLRPQLKELMSIWERAAALRARIGLGTAASEGLTPGTLERLHEAESLRASVVERLRSREHPYSRLHREGEVGRGGMGTILRVRDEDLKRHLALKVLSPSAGMQPDAVRFARFLEEAQVTAQLDHPGIVPVHELGLDDEGRLFFTMKLVKGGTLQEIFERVRSGSHEWTLTRALGILHQVCQAMAYAHDKRVIHRDLKPSNVMVGRYGEVFVMDWGIARILDAPDRHDIRLITSDAATLTHLSSARKEAAHAPDSALYTMDGDVVGTPAFMSPEQADGSVAEIGPLSDVYSIGAMLYQLLAGHAPYTRGDGPIGPAAIRHAVTQGPPPPIESAAPDAPAELHAICAKAMARAPEARYAGVAELGEDLRAFLENRVVAAFEGGALAELKKWVVRNRLTAAALSAALLAVIAALLIANAEQRRSNQRVRLTSDFYQLRYHIKQAEDLYPTLPEKAEAMNAWLDKSREFLARRQVHEKRLAREARPVEREGILATIEQLDALVDTGGLMADVEARLTLALSLADTEEWETQGGYSWGQVRDALQSGVYAEHPIQLPPQVGLVPLGPDPESGLQEFAHVLSGELPRRNNNTKRFQITETTCIVLVLIPGGPHWPTYESTELEPPLPTEEEERIDLHPFFLSKYEMTQGQWVRVAENPSFFTADTKFGPHEYNLTNPVDSIDRDTAARILARLALQLPTEAQLQYANRAGTLWPWWSGPEEISIQDKANLLDQFAKLHGGPPTWLYAFIDDGALASTHVGRYDPNDWGLHDTMGNLWEWTRDYMWDPPENAPPARSKDGLRYPEPNSFPLAYGGAFYSDTGALQSTYRYRLPGFRIAQGVRPMMPLPGVD